MTSRTIKGVAAWAHISEPSKEKTIERKNGGSTTIPCKYSIDVILSDADAKALKAHGLNVKTVKTEISGIEGSAGKPFINVKCSPVYPDGNAAPRPKCVDSQLNPFTGLIGNGSKVKVNLKEIPYELMGREGISARLLGVQVVELVEYKSKNTNSFDVVDGFVSETEEETSTFSSNLNSIAEASQDELEF